MRTAKATGYVAANDELRCYSERLVLGARFQGIYRDSPDEYVKRFAEQRSLNMNGLSASYLKQFGLHKAARMVQVRLKSYGFGLPVKDIE